MKTLLFLCLLICPAGAASVAIPALTTSWQSEFPVSGPQRLSRVQSSTEYVFDLNDRTGLTPGRAMEIVVSFAPVYAEWGSLWLGVFSLEPGPLTITAQGRLELFAGGQSVFTNTLSTVIGESTESTTGYMSASSDIAGFVAGSQPGDLRLVVPWDTDLTALRLVWSQDTTHSNGGMSSSTLSIGAGQAAVAGLGLLSVRSIPEPSLPALVLLTAVATTGTRRRVTGV